jgi:hypothetical protein
MNRPATHRAKPLSNGWNNCRSMLTGWKLADPRDVLTLDGSKAYCSVRFLAKTRATRMLRK